MLTYQFEDVVRCDMCGADPRQFRLLGIRLNRRQGLHPRQAAGIAVAVKKCGNCELVFADPQPIPKDFGAHYGAPEDYWSSDQIADEKGYFEKEIETAKRLLGVGNKMRALDVGAGLGKAMRSLTTAGFDTYGIEPSPEFRTAALSDARLSPDKLECAAVEDAVFPDCHFDFITFGAVLEHLRSPSRSLEAALRWLKPGGIIQAEVPSSRWLMSRLVNLYFRLAGTTLVTNISPMHVPFHLFEFGPRSFQRHGERVGYELAEYRVMVCSIPHVPRLLRAPLRWWMHITNTGMQLEVYLRKT